jgi:hypothetical protein
VLFPSYNSATLTRSCHDTQSKKREKKHTVLLPHLWHLCLSSLARTSHVPQPNFRACWEMQSFCVLRKRKWKMDWENIVLPLIQKRVNENVIKFFALLGRLISTWTSFKEIGFNRKVDSKVKFLFYFLF